MKLNHKFLGAAAIITAPFLGLQMSMNANENASIEKIYDLIFMLGWMCGLAALIRMKAVGESLAGKIVLIMQFVLVWNTIVWNVWAIVDPGNSSDLFFILGFFWPLSHLFMLVTGTFIAIAGKMKGWRGWMPLLAGLWLPVSALIILFVYDNNRIMNIRIAYTVLAYILLGLGIVTSSPKASTSKKFERKKGVFYKQTKQQPQLV